MKKLFLLLVVLFFVTQYSFAQDKGLGDKKIGIVNISDVMNKYNRRADIEKKFKGDEEKFNKKIKEKKNDLDKLKEDLQKSEDDVEREKISIEMLKAKKELELWGDLNSEIIQRDIEKAQLEMIRDIKKTIQEYGVKNKYFLILQAQPANAKQSDMRTALLTINLADVMYYDTTYDITGDIVELINLKYANQQKSK
jgi:Skp family chaperone for outer membrane proteins